MILKDASDLTPASIATQTQKASELLNIEIIFVTEALLAYDRKRLIEHKVSFIVPNNQMYLPTLGTDLREYIRSIRKKKILISPSTQAVLLHLLLHPEEKDLSAQALSSKLGYSKMTIIRSFDEMETLTFGETTSISRNKVFICNREPQELFKHSLQYLSSPVKKTVYIQDIPINQPILFAGFSALSQQTMISEPKQTTIAISLPQWKHLCDSKLVRQLPSNEVSAIKVEVWKYNPSLFSTKKMVDPISLYLSLKKTKDERTTIEIEELLKSIQW